MELYVLSPDLDIEYAITTYDEIIWTRKLNKPGTFKISFYFTTELNEYLVPGNIIVKTDNSEAGIIQTKKLKIDNKGQETIIIDGLFLSGYFNQRIVWGQIDINTTCELAMRQLVNDNCIVADENRVITNMILGDVQDYNATIIKQVEYENLQETLTEIAESCQCGYRVDLDLINKKMIFNVFEGQDLTDETEFRVIFSRDFDNILTQEYTHDISKHRNMCLIGGEEKENTERVFVTVGDDYQGVERFELFSDSAGTRSEIEEDGVKRTLTTTEYEALLASTAQEKLQSYTVKSAFNAKINAASETIYKEDYDLGDFVTCRDEKWGIQVDTQITEITETYSKKEKSIEITFGDDVLTLIDLIKTKMKG